MAIKILKKKSTSKPATKAKPGVKKGPIGKAPAKKAPAKKAPAKKAPVKKTPAKKAPVKKTPAKKAPAKKAPVKKTPAKKAPGRPFPSKVSPANGPTPAPTVVASAISQPLVEERRLVMPPPPRHVRSAKKVAPLKPIKLAPLPATVSESEGPFTATEFKAVRGELAKELVRLKSELVAVELEMDSLIRESGEGAGDDQADAGTKTFEREHEMSLVINARDMVLQTERALERIDSKTYGQCEECGNPIGKARLQVFPRATLCMVCKQKEERR